MHKLLQPLKKISIENAFIFLVFIIILNVYASITMLFNGSWSYHSNFPYYNYLLKALSEFRLNINSNIHMDLAFFKGKWYMYWGPAPVFYVLPFYLLWGINASDIFYVFIAGFINILLMFYVIKNALKYFKIQISSFSKIFLLLNFAFCSPNFYLSLNGNVWATTQLIGIFYLLLCLIFYFRFLQNINFMISLFLSVIFFNLAWLSRYSLVFSGLLFIFPILNFYKNNERQKLKRAIFIFIGIFSISLTIIFLYNFLKFGNMFELGERFVKAIPFENQIHERGKFLSSDYFLHNINYYFFKPLLFKSKFPFLALDVEGNSIFFVYPISIFAFFLVFKNIFKKYQGFYYPALLVIVLTLASFLFLFTTGRYQFGIRYLLDIFPLFIILLCFVIDRVPNYIKIIFLAYGIPVNILGVISYQHVIIELMKHIRLF